MCLDMQTSWRGMIADFVCKARSYENDNENLGFALSEKVKEMIFATVLGWKVKFAGEEV